LELALDMYAVGEAMMAHRLRREDPRASEAVIEARLRVWLAERPGAELGDAVGRGRRWAPAPP
jgi:hypothetical protein